MDIETVKVFTKTGGTVSVSCFVIYSIVDNLFKEPVYYFLGSEKIFILLLFILGVMPSDVTHVWN